MKKFLSVLLVLVMVLSLVPVTAFAEGLTEISSIRFAGLPKRAVGDEAGTLTYSVNPYKQIAVNVAKWTTDNSDFSGTFEKGIAYYAYFELSAKEGYEFSSSLTKSNIRTNVGVVEMVEVSADKTSCIVKVKIVGPVEHYVTLNTNGGSIISGNIAKYTEGIGATLPTDVTKTGYEFGGWYENEDLSGTAVTEIGAEETTNKVFYAKWTAIEYDITYNLDGGTNAASNPEKYTIEDAVALQAPTKDGYVFTGWTWEGQTDPDTDVAFSGETGDKTYTANWVERLYTITVKESENGTVTADKAEAAEGETVTLTVEAAEGYEVESVKYNDTVITAVDGVYSFSMPAADVDVSAVFAEVEDEEEEDKEEENEKPSQPIFPLLPGLGNPFNDVTCNDWFHDEVLDVYWKGLMNGLEKHKFGPNEKVTRAMIVTILWRLEGEPDAAAAGFTDVPSGMWYTEAVDWANEKGVVNGYGNGAFGPNDAITREQLAAILYRYAAYKGYWNVNYYTNDNLSQYADVNEVGSWAKDAMNWAVGYELINGMDSRLAPKAGATRAQAAAILSRFLG